MARCPDADILHPPGIAPVRLPSIANVWSGGKTKGSLTAVRRYRNRELAASKIIIWLLRTGRLFDAVSAAQRRLRPVVDRLAPRTPEVTRHARHRREQPAADAQGLG